MNTHDILRSALGKTIDGIVSNSKDTFENFVLLFTDGTSIKIEAENIGMGCACIKATQVNKYPDLDYS